MGGEELQSIFAIGHMVELGGGDIIFVSKHALRKEDRGLARCFKRGEGASPTGRRRADVWRSCSAPHRQMGWRDRYMGTLGRFWVRWNTDDERHKLWREAVRE